MMIYVLMVIAIVTVLVGGTLVVIAPMSSPP